MAMASPSSRNQTSPRSYSSAFASTSAAVTNFSTGTYSAANVRVQEQRPVRLLAESSQGRWSIMVTTTTTTTTTSREKMTCMCSPTNHPGSFRCAYHKQLAEKQKQKTKSLSCRRLYLLRSAMKNWVVRNGGVEEGDKIVSTLIRPSSHHLRRREPFEPRPTRLSLMSKLQDHS